MVKRSHGFRVKTRQKLRKKVREKGLAPLTRSLQEFDDGERVSIVIDPAIHRGMPHPRFQGLTGRVVERRGSSYVVSILDGNKEKTLLARPEHLKGHRSA